MAWSGKSPGEASPFRRLRIVSEPVSDYVHYEYDITEAHNVAAGEEVRWLSRRAASVLFLPPSDFWVIDGVVVFNHFGGAGNWIDEELREDEALATRLTEAFDAAWALGTPHTDYRLPAS